MPADSGSYPRQCTYELNSVCKCNIPARRALRTSKQLLRHRRQNRSRNRSYRREHRHTLRWGILPTPQEEACEEGTQSRHRGKDASYSYTVSECHKAPYGSDFGRWGAEDVPERPATTNSWNLGG